VRLEERGAQRVLRLPAQFERGVRSRGAQLHGGVQLDRLAADSLSLEFAAGGPLQVRERGRRGGVTAAVERPLEAGPPDAASPRTSDAEGREHPGQRVQQQ